MSSFSISAKNIMGILPDDEGDKRALFFNRMADADQSIEKNWDDMYWTTDDGVSQKEADTFIGWFDIDGNKELDMGEITYAYAAIVNHMCEVEDSFDDKTRTYNKKLANDMLEYIAGDVEYMGANPGRNNYADNPVVINKLIEESEKKAFLMFQEGKCKFLYLEEEETPSGQY